MSNRDALICATWHLSAVPSSRRFSFDPKADQRSRGDTDGIYRISLNEIAAAFGTGAGNFFHVLLRRGVEGKRRPDDPQFYPGGKRPGKRSRPTVGQRLWVKRRVSPGRLL